MTSFVPPPRCRGSATSDSRGGATKEERKGAQVGGHPHMMSALRGLEGVSPEEDDNTNRLRDHDSDTRSGVVLILRHKCERLKPSSPISEHSF